MALLVFLLGTPRDEYSLFRVPTQRISTVLKSTSIEAAIWLARSRFVHERGSFWELGAFYCGGFRARFSAKEASAAVGRRRARIVLDADDGDANGIVTQFVLGQQHVRQEAVRLENRRRGRIAHADLGNLAIA